MNSTVRILFFGSIIIVSLLFFSTCSDNPSSSSSNQETERITDQPIDKLPGDENEPITNATYDQSAPTDATEENVSTVENDGIEQRVLRTEIEIVLNP